MEGRTIFMAKKKENVTEEIKVQESTVKAPVKKAAAKKTVAKKNTTKIINNKSTIKKKYR